MPKMHTAKQTQYAQLPYMQIHQPSRCNRDLIELVLLQACYSANKHRCSSSCGDAEITTDLDGIVRNWCNYVFVFLWLMPVLSLCDWFNVYDV